MRIEIKFGENKKVKCHFNGFTVESDQCLEDHGDGDFPEPFDYFLCSIALCASAYIRNYLETRNLDLGQIRIVQESERDQEDRYRINFKMKVVVPEDFPERHRKGIEKAAQLCSVKRAVSTGINFEIDVQS